MKKRQKMKNLAYPPMQKGATFGIEQVKERIKAAIAKHAGN